jgi:hypothetical protein
MRYYFHIRINEGLIPDDEGTEILDADDAREKAVQSAHELAREFPLGGGGVNLQSIEVVDETGRALFALPIYRQANSTDLVGAN